MKKLLTALLIPCSLALSAQTIDAYFQKIRNNAAALTVFFSQMPKGGDLHHHFSGSVYGETFLEAAVQRGFFVNTRTLQIAEAKPDADTVWVSLQEAKNGRGFDALKVRLLQFWSVKDYDGAEPAAEHFFNSFDRFGPAAGYAALEGLQEIKDRAKAENVSYIETSIGGLRCPNLFGDDAALTARLLAAGKNRTKAGLDVLLDSLWRIAENNNADCVAAFQRSLRDRHRVMGLDDSSFVLRFQSSVNRNVPPLAFFSSLVAAFQAADGDSLVVGVNILAPEHYETSMRDYWLHMQMFRFVRSKYKNVKYAMHAGELTLGLVKPEELTWHINEAVFTAGADRIGHGVDLPYEKDADLLLAKMKSDAVAVEINLTSNEAILGVKDDRHPFLLYKAAGVPIVISTDDAGILRTSLTEQFVLLAKRYPSVSYTDIKGFVFNSIAHSFINQPSLKERLRKDLIAAFQKFERKILALRKR